MHGAWVTTRAKHVLLLAEKLLLLPYSSDVSTFMTCLSEKKTHRRHAVSVYSMLILNLKALVEPIPSPSIGIVALENVRGLTAVLSCPLVASSYPRPFTRVG